MNQQPPYSPLPEADICYRAMQAKDARFDGRFFVCVTSTGIYCRPVCPAQVPRRAHCRFVPSAAAAEAAGFRSCLRCRPESAPGTPAWSGTAAVVSRALRLIEAGALDNGRLETLATRLGLGERQLRRLFMTHIGAGPQAVAANRRLLTAKQLISDTDMPLADVAFAAGYRSLRRFNDAILAAYGMPPGALRRTATPLPGGSIRIRLGFRPPYDFAHLLGYLRDRALPGVEQVDAGHYRRLFCLDATQGLIDVSLASDGRALEARITPLAGGGILPVRQLAARLRRLFDLDADPDAVRNVLGDDPLIGPRLARVPGLRVPGAFDGFELAVRAVLGQQVSVRGATTLTGRLIARLGTPLATPVGGLTHHFPTAAALAAGSLEGLGITGQRIRTLQHLAQAVVDGTLDFSPGTALASLTSLPGIGDWTAHYIALRALGEPDAFPAADLGLRKAAGQGTPVSARYLAQLAEPWRPWRGYAALALWSIERIASGDDHV
ncbi:Ada metal-binding domain-containing protein [Alcanivorax sp. S71-1-4]|jgi:AraC family transcriptional regulator, regulatory protein of adaptative response / DNA-3-methyladenine glycosylase II|uniref:DNA-3-methyladenine glycosylase 2 n=1 Tax=Alcanivorax sp. S71-1-4 TaxID=1177159 RepID=UPI00135B6729|nr:DNA-3-methyladenine glycosylase 2 [Alcanivorax sp. S71-1-4]KAF0808266.1 Ada metal-binding domain-containing protein [Alcanivorax sp. S71-1-4]